MLLTKVAVGAKSLEIGNFRKIYDRNKEARLMFEDASNVR